MNILLDCGANIGQGFERLKGLLNIDSSWDVYMFEPNPECIPFLRAKYKHNIINKAVGIDNKRKKFTTEFCEVAKNWTGGASHIIGSDWVKPSYIKDKNLKNGQYVECIDLSRFIFTIMENPEWDIDSSKIFLKLDIEGMEFPILDKMIKQGNLVYIDSIFVEWHERLLNQDVSRDKYIEYFKLNNINYSEWVY